MVNFRDILLPDSRFDIGPDGLEFQLRLPTYRSVPLSCVVVQRLAIDGTDIDLSDAVLEVDGAHYRLPEMPYRHDVEWFVGDAGRLHVPVAGDDWTGLHEVALTVGMRMPPYIFWDKPSDICATTRTMSGIRRSVAPEVPANGIKLGTSLYSFSPELQSGLSVPELLRQVRIRGLGPGVEVVGHQMFSGFPFVPQAQIDDLRRGLDATGLTLVAVDGFADIGVRTDRPLTIAETVELLAHQIEAARRLGSPLLKVQYTVAPEVFRQLVPIAERAGVRIGVEIHAPQSVDDPTIRELVSLFRAHGDGWLGFVPDTGASVSRIPPAFVEAYRRKGIPAPIIEMVTAAWDTARREQRDQVAERTAVEHAALAHPDGGEEAAAFAFRAFHWFGYQPAQRWAELGSLIFHVHGKIFAADPGGRGDTSIPHREIFRALEGVGYQGWVCSEYEAWQWQEAEIWPPDDLRIAAEQHRVWRELLSERPVSAATTR